MNRDVCAASELPAGTMLETTLGERTVVVARTQAGRLYAFSGRCVHQGAPLAAGRLLSAVEGEVTGDYRLSGCRDVVKCPWHGYEYDLESGAVLFDPRRRLRVFRVRELVGRVVIETREAACAA